MCANFIYFKSKSFLEYTWCCKRVSIWNLSPPRGEPCIKINSNQKSIHKSLKCICQTQLAQLFKVFSFTLVSNKVGYLVTWTNNNLKFRSLRQYQFPFSVLNIRFFNWFITHHFGLKQKSNPKDGINLSFFLLFLILRYLNFTILLSPKEGSKNIASKLNYWRYFSR